LLNTSYKNGYFIHCREDNTELKVKNGTSLQEIDKLLNKNIIQKLNEIKIAVDKNTKELNLFLSESKLQDFLKLHADYIDSDTRLGIYFDELKKIKLYLREPILIQGFYLIDKNGQYIDVFDKTHKVSPYIGYSMGKPVDCYLLKDHRLNGLDGIAEAIKNIVSLRNTSTTVCVLDAWLSA
jgi:hypothetical protein